jgi:hypothetical protein
MIRNRAVHELLKHMGGNAILFHQMSHTNGALIRIPSASSASGYTMMLKRKKNFMKELLKFMGECLNESTLDHCNGKSNAARCILQYFFENIEEEFKEVAHNKNLLLTKGQQKMEPS